MCLIKVISAIERDDLDVRLLEVVVCSGGPTEPDLIPRACGADDAVAREGVSTRTVEVLGEPIEPVGGGRGGSVASPTGDSDITPEIGVRAFLKRVHSQLGVAVVPSPKDLVACVLRQMIAPHIAARRIRRIREFKSDGAGRLNAGERGTYDLEARCASAAAPCIPTDVKRVVPDGEIGVVRAGAFPEEAWSEIPIGPRGAVTVLDVSGTCHSKTVPGALQKPDEAVDRWRILDDLVAAESDRVVREYGRGIEDLEGAASIGRVGNSPICGDEDHSAATGSARLGACGRGVPATTDSGAVDADGVVGIEGDRGRIADRSGFWLGTGGCRSARHKRHLRNRRRTLVYVFIHPRFLRRIFAALNFMCRGLNLAEIVRAGRSGRQNDEGVYFERPGSSFVVAILVIVLALFPHPIGS